MGKEFDGLHDSMYESFFQYCAAIGSVDSLRYLSRSACVAMRSTPKSLPTSDECGRCNTNKNLIVSDLELELPRFRGRFSAWLSSRFGYCDGFL